MNWAYAHLLINHVPVLGTVFGVLLLAAGLWRRKSDLVVASLVTFLVCGLGAAAAVWTGERAEDLAEDLPGVTEEVVHEHEEAGEQARWASLLLGAAALAALLYRRRAQGGPRWLDALVLLLALVAAGLMARAADLGGQIRHTEVRGGLTAPPPATQNGSG
jgi:hypothetical protein